MEKMFRHKQRAYTHKKNLSENNKTRCADRTPRFSMLAGAIIGPTLLLIEVIRMGRRRVSGILWELVAFYGNKPVIKGRKGSE
jgi:hypothetical protein